MQSLTERLEVRLPPATVRALREEARTRGTSVGALVREAIEHLLTEDEAAQEARLRAAEELFQIGAPVADWPVMKGEIEAAYRDAQRP